MSDIPVKRILNRKPSLPSLLNYDLVHYLPKNALNKSTFSFNFGFLNKAPVVWPFPEAPLDQGNTGHCIGDGGAGFLGTAPIETPVSQKTADDLYYLCKVKDGEPGQENGSDVHTLAKVLRDLKRIGGYAFAHSTDVISYWLRHRGPLVFGTSWTQDMMATDVQGFVHITGDVVGGHCTCARGIRTFNGKDAYYVQNSWNHQFGDPAGCYYIWATDFNQLLHAQGEALAAIERPL